MKPSKQEKLDAAKQWLMDKDIQFVENRNGHLIIYKSGSTKLADWWSTTERWHFTDGSGYVGETGKLECLKRINK
ncbi:hypothetical protein D3C79_978860 [compost metagenome]